MATPVLIPVSEYLNTTYRPDCDYIYGELKERNVGEKSHGTLQGVLFAIFFANLDTWEARPFIEQRVQTSAENYRVADVCVLRIGDSPEVIVATAPPLLCIEILSRGDSITSMQERIADYLSMGVEHIWLIDPIRRRAWFTLQSSLQEVSQSALSIPGTLIHIPLADVFEQLDRIAARH